MPSRYTSGHAAGWSLGRESRVSLHATGGNLDERSETRAVRLHVALPRDTSGNDQRRQNLCALDCNLYQRFMKALLVPDKHRSREDLSLQRVARHISRTVASMRHSTHEAMRNLECHLQDNKEFSGHQFLATAYRFQEPSVRTHAGRYRTSHA